MEFFKISDTAFTFDGYPVSYVELTGTLFGFLSVYFASRGNILTWPTGIINEIFLLVLFFQVQLYADMFLQVYFLAITVYGWYNWQTNPKTEAVLRMPNFKRMMLIMAIVLASVGMGYSMQHIHQYLPDYFAVPAAYPFVDSFVMVCSIAATYLLAQKNVENWIIWIVVDLVSIALFYKKAIYFLSLEYVFFLLLASYGFYNWNQTRTS
jgi:nicotinamide mononucleotide transporter